MIKVKNTLISAMAIGLLAGSAIGVAAQDEAVVGPSSEGAELVPGVDLVATEVEPGVYRVINDGVRDLSWPVEPEALSPDRPPGNAYWQEARRAHIVANEEGVWLGRPGGITRLGEEGFVGPIEEGRPPYSKWFEVTIDDALYVNRPPMILGEDGWRKIERPRVRGFDFPPSGFGGSLHFGPDGSLWVRGNTDKDTRKERSAFARRDADGWSLVKVPLPRPKMRSWPGIEEVVATDDGIVVLRGDRFLQRYDGERWETLPRPDNGMMGLYVGDDGTIWVGSREEELVFYRLDADGSGWTTHEVGARPPMETPGLIRGTVLVRPGPDGALWFAPGDGERKDGRCDGVARYDGTTTTRFLRGLCVYDIAFGPHGDAWVLAGDWKGSIWDPDEVGPVEPYVVTSEVMTPVE